jgi:uncharacterized delta-60 repeat protein
MLGVAALLALAMGSQAAEAQGATHLDPSFGQGGRAMLPPHFDATSVSALMHDDSLVVSTGQSLKRLSPEGQLDESFGEGGTLTPPALPDGIFNIAGLAADSQDRLIVAGTSILPEDEPYPRLGFPKGPQAVRILRYLSNGSIDLSFGDRGVVETDFGLPPPQDDSGRPFLTRPWVEATGVVLDAQDRVIVTGGASAGLRSACAHDWFWDTLTYAAFVARFTETGAIDTSFGGGDGIVGGHSTAENPLHAELSITPLIGPDGQVTYAGSQGLCPRAGGFGLVRLAEDGVLQSNFGVQGAVRDFGEDTAMEPDGSILAFEWVSPWYYPKEPLQVRVTHLGTNGRPVRSYGRNGHVIVKSPGGAGSHLGTLALDARGRVLLGGTMISARKFHDPPGSEKMRHRHSFVLVRLRPSGQLDQAFGPHGWVATGFGSLGVTESSLLLDSQGRAVIVGAYGPSDNKGLVVARFLIDR